ncbi:hypothetical protein F5Y14DRAFT_374241 [Nemania sp. NC0429]|nr:hypothetical protein F5Y14DRAFT_374241 [Nemania sp. NC0429]
MTWRGPRSSFPWIHLAICCRIRLPNLPSLTLSLSIAVYFFSISIFFTPPSQHQLLRRCDVVGSSFAPLHCSYQHPSIEEKRRPGRHCLLDGTDGSQALTLSIPQARIGLRFSSFLSLGSGLIPISSHSSQCATRERRLVDKMRRDETIPSLVPPVPSCLFPPPPPQS